MAQEPQLSPDSLWQRIRVFIDSMGLLVVGAGLLALVVGLIITLVISELSNYGLLLTILGVVLLILALISSSSDFLKALTARRGRYGVSVGVLILLFTAILVLLNFISYRNNTRFDVTASQHFSLASQTIDRLEALDDRIQATAFYAESNTTYAILTQQADDLFSEFVRHTDKLEFRFIDPELQPSTARRYGGIEDGTIVFENLDRNRTFKISTPPVTEQEFSTALLVVAGEEKEQKQIYFLTGHSERDSTDETAPDGYGLARAALAAENYVVRTLNIQTVNPDEGLPKDAAAIIVAGPDPDRVLLTTAAAGRVNESAILEEYLRDGGRAVFLLDPGTNESWLAVLGKWGVGLSEYSIVDMESAIFGDSRTPIIRRSQYSPTSPITSPLDDTLFPGVASVINLIPDSEQEQSLVNIEPLALTNLDSWTETDLDQVNFDSALDQRGPHSIAVAITAMAPHGEAVAPDFDPDHLTTIVVFGDSDFASNQFFSSLNNGDFLLNSVNWVTKDVELINVRPKPFPFRQLIVDTKQLDFIRYTSYFLLPAMLAALAILVWWRRR